MVFVKEHNKLKRLVFLLFMVSFSVWSCSEKKKGDTGNSDNDFHLRQVVVVEMYPAGNEILVKGVENGINMWLVVPEQKISEGDKIFFTGSDLKIKRNFWSNELNQTFDSVFFAERITVQAGVSKITAHEQSLKMPPGHTGGRVAPVKQSVSVNPLPGGLSIAMLYEHKKEYANKKRRVRGVVVKVNPNIMGRNWVHLQDGTSFQNHFDLTATTQAAVNTGDTVIFDGTIALDKDFTAGYFYDLIMENAVLEVKK